MVVGGVKYSNWGKLAGISSVPRLDIQLKSILSADSVVEGSLEARCMSRSEPQQAENK